MKINSFKKTMASVLAIALISLSLGRVGYAQKPKEVSLKINNENINLESKAKNVEGLLEDINYSLDKDYLINYDLDHKLEDDMKIEISTMKNLEINHANNLIKTKSYKNTVAEVLEENNIELGNDDKVYPGLDSTVEDNDMIKIDVIEYKDYKQEKKIKFKTVKKYDFDLDYGREEIKVEGKDGLKELSFRKTFKNGELVSDSQVNEKILEKKIDQVVRVGSKEVVQKTTDFKTISKKNNQMFRDQEKTVQEGQVGIEELVYENKNGKRVLKSEKTVQEVKNKIVEKGTKKRVSIPNGPTTHLPSGAGSFKSYMDYRAITSRTSPQWALQYNGSTYTGNYGVRMLGNRYVVAMSSKYGFVGDKVDIYLANGNTLKVVIGDIKKSFEVDSYGRHPDGSVVEFIVDSSAIPSIARTYGSFGAVSEFSGPVTKITPVK